MPRISVCIPAYNRPSTLADLLGSVINQDFPDYEIVICEDHSPKRLQIREVVTQTQHAYPGKTINYFENEKNLGYDGNLRRLLEVATGDYCLFLGDDDLLCPEALNRLGAVLERYPNLGAVNRAYRSIDRFTGAILTENRYYVGDRYFPAGIDTVVSFYRRFVTICGLVVQRERSLSLATERYDGTLLYQQHLVGNLLLDMDGYYISDVIALRRAGEAHYFGSSKAEQGIFAPRTLTPEHSVNFMRGMLRIASDMESSRDVPVYERILADLAMYAYPFLAEHSVNKRLFFSYTRELSKLGFGKHPMFWVYVLLLTLFDRHTIHKGIEFIKRMNKRTPRLSKCYEGIPISSP